MAHNENRIYWIDKGGSAIKAVSVRTLYCPAEIFQNFCSVCSIPHTFLWVGSDADKEQLNRSAVGRAAVCYLKNAKRCTVHSRSPRGSSRKVAFYIFFLSFSQSISLCTFVSLCTATYRLSRTHLGISFPTEKMKNSVAKWNDFCLLVSLCCFSQRDLSCFLW